MAASATLRARGRLIEGRRKRNCANTLTRQKSVQAYDSAHRRKGSDRAARIRAHRRGAEARRNRTGRPAARTPGDAADRPGIAPPGP